MITIGSLFNFIAIPLFILGIFSVDFQELFKGPTFLMIISSWLPFTGSILIFIGIIYYRKGERWLLWLSTANLLIMPYIIYWNFPII